MPEPLRANVLRFPMPASSTQPLETSRRGRLECVIWTAPGVFQAGHVVSTQELWHKAFLKRWGFPLPTICFQEDAELDAWEWTLNLRSREVFRGRLTGPPLESIGGELLERPWRLLTYEFFRCQMGELEEQEPFLVQEVSSRLDLVLVWQVFQAILKAGGDLRNVPAKLERLLVEAVGQTREIILSPRLISALLQS